MRSYKKAIISFLVCAMTGSAFASVNGNLGHFFSSLGFSGNATSSHAFQDQSAGYYSGGGIFLRQQVQDVQLIHVDAPSISAGCSGIDTYLGGFSYINIDRIVALGKQIMAGAPGYIFHLALTAAVPEMADTLQTIQSWLQKINSMNINSCETTQELVGGLLPKIQGAQQEICKDLASHDGALADWASARQDCGAGKQSEKYLDRASKDPKYKNAVVTNKNLIWSILQQNAFLSSDDQLAELFMSLSGTVIFDKNSKPTYYPSLVDNRSLIKALLHGGQAPILACQNTGADQCLNIRKDTITIDQDKALDNQVQKMIIGLINAVQSDAPITDQQKGFVESTTVPIMKYISVASSLKMGQGLVDINQYADVIAEDVLAQYLSESLQVIKNSLQAAGQFPDEVQKNLQQSIESAQQTVAQMQAGAYQKIQNALGLVRNMRFLESEVSSALSGNFGSNMDFGEGK